MSSTTTIGIKVKENGYLSISADCLTLLDNQTEKYLQACNPHKGDAGEDIWLDGARQGVTHMQQQLFAARQQIKELQEWHDSHL